MKKTVIMTIMFLLLTATLILASYAIGSKIRVRVNTNVNQWTQTATDVTTKADVFADHSVAGLDRVLISVENQSTTVPLSDLDILLTDDNNNYTDAFEVVAALATNVYMVNGYSSCSGTLAALGKCYTILPVAHGFTSLKVQAYATAEVSVKTIVTGWRL